MFVVWIVIGCILWLTIGLALKVRCLNVELQTTKNYDNAYHSREQLGNERVSVDYSKLYASKKNIQM